jgi:hypothetical protein
MKKTTLIFALFFFIFSLGNATANFKEPVVSTKLMKKSVAVFIKNNYPARVKLTIVFSNQQKKILKTDSGRCNRKRPADCFYIFNLRDLGRTYSKKAVYRILAGKPFRVRVSGKDRYRCQGKMGRCQAVKE